MSIIEDITFAESILFANSKHKKVKYAKDLKLNRFVVIYPDRIQGETEDEELWDYTLDSFRTRVDAQNFIRHYEKQLPNDIKKYLSPILVDLNKSR